MKLTLLLLLFLVFSISVHAEIALRAEPSSTEISSDENISLEITAQMEDLNSKAEEPHFDAVDFYEVNAYAGSTGVVSSYVNDGSGGRFQTQKTQSFIYVLKPKKTGRLVIQNITSKINGQIVRAPNVTIEVGSTPSRQQQSGSSPYSHQRRTPFPQPGLHSEGHNLDFLIKTEPSKTVVYKGEQIILTYAIYTRAQILGVQIERYPSVSGFLKEDLDIPVLNNPLRYSRSVYKGKEYYRAVLAQYAVFPLKEGTLTIDPLAGKFSYRGQTNLQMGDDDDPFGMINQFFGAMQTRTESKLSDRVSIEVKPLPEQGKPASFGGLVGDFDISVTADKPSVKIGEALNVKVRVFGKGHAGGLETLKVNWPADFELYEDKSQTHYQKTGTSERVFDFMLIPKTKGHFQIPAIELSMFNPENKSYVTRVSTPVGVDVLDGSVGSVYVAKPSDSKETKIIEDLRYWMPENISNTSSLIESLSKGLALFSVVILAMTLGFYSINKFDFNWLKYFKNREKSLKDQLAKLEKTSNLSLQEYLGQVTAFLAAVCQRKYKLSIGSLTREEIRAALEERGALPEVSKGLSELIEKCENQRFIPMGQGIQNGASREIHLDIQNHLKNLVELISTK